MFTEFLKEGCVLIVFAGLFLVMFLGFICIMVAVLTHFFSDSRKDCRTATERRTLFSVSDIADIEEYELKGISKNIADIAKYLRTIEFSLFFGEENVSKNIADIAERLKGLDDRLFWIERYENDILNELRKGPMEPAEDKLTSIDKEDFSDVAYGCDDCEEEEELVSAILK